jgi:hypothetical protein
MQYKSTIGFFRNISPRNYLKIILWFLLYYVFRKMGRFIINLTKLKTTEMVSVLVLFTIPYVVYSNLGERKAGEKSGYSVFNENFEALPGELNVKQFENEIRYRN